LRVGKRKIAAGDVVSGDGQASGECRAGEGRKQQQTREHDDPIW
jgi:hypothetical protein